jgi:hypothetical protein
VLFRQAADGDLTSVHLGLVPVLFGGGLRPFEYIGTELLEVERIWVVESPTRTDIAFRIVA